MPRSSAVRCVAIVLAAGCALAAGCITGKSGYLPDLLSAGDVDPHTRRIVLRPEQGTAPVRGTQVFIATVYDDGGQPRRNRRVEWTVQGPGSITEVGQGGYLPGRNGSADAKFAYSDTESADRRIHRGGDDFTIGPGQTWCRVTCAIEGETTVIAHCPAIQDRDQNRAEAHIAWTDADLRFPPPATARAGGEFVLNTTVLAPPDRIAGYRVRYRIVDGPAAALTAEPGGQVSSVTEAIAAVGEDGAGRMHIAQPLPARGTNRIAVEVEKPDPARRGQYLLVTKGETRVTWDAPHLDVGVSAPKTLGVNQEATITYTVSGQAEGVVALNARVPDEMVIIRTDPKAAIDGPTLVWTLPATPDGKPQSVTAVLRPVRLGSVDLSAEGRTADGLTGRGSATATIAQPKLLLRLDGPAMGIAGEPLPFRVTVTNAGDWAAEKIRVHGRFDDGLDADGKPGALDETIPALPAGQSKTIALPLTARRGGKFKMEVAAAGDRSLTATPQTATVEVKEAQLALSVHGPARGYIGQEVTWELAVVTGSVPLKDVVLKVTLPPELTFVRATDGGRLVGRQVIWNYGTALGGRTRQIPPSVTAVCKTASPRVVMSATITGTPLLETDGATRPVKLAKPLGPDRPVEAAIEIVGVPALQLSVKDSADPVTVGERVTYTVRVKNAGTLAARKVEVVALLPNVVRATRGTGPAAAARIGHDASGNDTVTFPAVDSLAPGAEATFVVEAEAAIVGDARCQVEVRSASQKEALHAVEPTRIVPSQRQPFEK